MPTKQSRGDSVSYSFLIFPPALQRSTFRLTAVSFVCLSSALSQRPRRLLTGADALYDEVAARPATVAESLPHTQEPPGPHRRPAAGSGASLRGGPGLSAESPAAGAASTPGDV